MPVPTSQPRNLPVPYAVSATSLSGFKPKVFSLRNGFNGYSALSPVIGLV